VAQIVAKRNLRSPLDFGPFQGEAETVAQKILFSVGLRLRRAEAHEKRCCRT
jgi:hypothetical protein